MVTCGNVFNKDLFDDQKSIMMLYFKSLLLNEWPTLRMYRFMFCIWFLLKLLKTHLFIEYFVIIFWVYSHWKWTLYLRMGQKSFYLLLAFSRFNNFTLKIFCTGSFPRSGILIWNVNIYFCTECKLTEGFSPSLLLFVLFIFSFSFILSILQAAELNTHNGKRMIYVNSRATESDERVETLIPASDVERGDKVGVINTDLHGPSCEVSSNCFRSSVMLSNDQFHLLWIVERARGRGPFTSLLARIHCL